MNILITGASGFFGTNFLSYINPELKNNHRIILLTSKEIEDFLCLHYSDYRRTFSDTLFADNNIDCIDTVLLMGAYVEHGEKEHIVRNHIASIDSMVYLLDHLPNVPKRIVYLSSVAVYGYTQDGTYTVGEMKTVSEETPTNPKRTYALSKLLCERMILEYGSENGTETVILRLGTTYGKGRKFLDFLGTCVKCAKSGNTMDMYASIEQTWNYVYADDVSKWIWNALTLEKVDSPINLVSSRSYTTKEVLDIMSEVYPEFKYIVNSEHEKTGQDRIFDARKREKYLGEESYDLRKGLMEIRKSQIREGGGQ